MAPFKRFLICFFNRPTCDTNLHAVFICSNSLCSSLDLTLEVFSKCRLRQTILPLVSQREFVLLYSGVLPPDSVLACSKSNTDSEFNQKSTKKTEPRTWKSEMGGKTVPSASPDNSVIVSARGEGRGSSKSGEHPTTSTATSPLHQSSPPVPQPSHQTVRNKNPRPRVELKLSKCTLQHHLKAADDAKHSKTQSKTRIIMSLSSPALCEGISVRGSPETTTPLPPHAGPPVCENKRERGEEPDGEELKEDTKSLVCETKEEL